MQRAYVLVWHDLSDNQLEVTLYATFEAMLRNFKRCYRADKEEYDIAEYVCDTEGEELYYRIDDEWEYIGYAREVNQ